MDKKSKILLAALIILVAGSIFMTYQRTFVAKNFYTIDSSSDASSTPSSE